MSWSVPGSMAFVCPRYGTEVLGGVETVVRQMAERLVRDGLPVEVLTTCAVDHYTWDNHYPPGEADVHGVRVRRFPIERGDGRWHRAIGERIGAGIRTSFEEQELWINDGFRSARLFHELLQTQERYHTILLTPYMFWTTYACSQIAPDKTVLRPCLHDEPFARLEIYRSAFRDARGITFNTPPERDLAARLFDLPDRHEIVGEGVEVPESYDAERFRKTYGIDGPFLLYTGRREWGKNVDMLIEMFANYVRRTPTDVRLVLGGKGDVTVPEDVAPRVVDVGFLPEQDKHDAFAAATATCQPSRWESFSRLLMESWLAETPVLAFDECAVSAYHVEQSGGGLPFTDEIEFGLALDLLLGDQPLRAEMGRRGRQYVLANYTWDVTIERFVRCVQEWACAS